MIRRTLVLTFNTNKEIIRSSLSYNTSARHERHECGTNATRTTRVQHECDTSDTSATRVRNLILITTRVKTYFHTSILAMGQMKDYKEKNFILRTTFWKCAPQELNFVIAKVISKGYTLECSCKCSCTFLHSYA